MTQPVPDRPVGGRTASVLVQLDCNARCPFCSTRVYTEQGISSPVDWRAGVARRAKDYTLSLAELERQYDTLWQQGVRHVTLQGGEPTLHESLCDLVAYGWRKGFDEQTIVSNGRRFADAAFARRLVEAAPTTVVLSIFGDDAATHDASMGVFGAFDELLQGVKTLVALGAGQPGRRPSLLSQLTLHAFNHESLPRMLSFWHGVGLRDFSVRLLRETENTQRDARGWFFDLARLVSPLQQALDFTADHPGTSLRFEELPRCLLPAPWLPAVLLDAGTNPNLAREHLQVARHFELAQQSRRAQSGADACAACELRAQCLKPEEPWASLLSTPLRPIDVNAELSALGDGPLPAQAVAHVQALVDAPHSDRLVAVTPAHRRRLRARLVDAARPHGAAALAKALLSERLRRDSGQRLRAYGPARLAVRFVSFALAGVSALVPASSVATLAAVRNEPMRLSLSKHTWLGADRHLGVWLQPPSRATAGRAIVTVLYDEGIIDEQALSAIVGWLLEA